MRRAAAVLTLAAGGVLACATAGGSQVQSDLDAIQKQLWAMQKENAALLDQLTALKEARAQAAAPEAVAGETRVRLEAIERDLEALRARSEEVDFRLGAVLEDLRATRASLDDLRRRVDLTGALPPPGGLQQGAPASPAGGPGGTPAPPGPLAGAPAVDTTGATGGAPGLPGAAAPVAPAAGPVMVTPGAAAAGSGAAADDLYNRAYADYSRGNYSLALEELQELIDRYPDHPRADDARYLVGEVHFSQQEYPQAVAAFDLMMKSPRPGARMPAAHLKKGLALLEMNRTADAVIQLQHVVTAYPRTEEARLARERLEALGLQER